MAISSKSELRALLRELKKQKKLLTQHEFSEFLGYHKGYVPKALSSKDPLPDELLKKINETDFSGTKNVPGVAKNGPAKQQSAVSNNELAKDLIESQKETISLLKEKQANYDVLAKMLEDQKGILTGLVSRLQSLEGVLEYAKGSFETHVFSKEQKKDKRPG